MGGTKSTGDHSADAVGASPVITPERADQRVGLQTQQDTSLPPIGEPTLRRFDRYVVLGVLGRGGTGVVLRGYDEQLERPVAIKVLRGQLGARPIARLRREARAMAKLSHPNVVQVYEVGECDGQAFVTMELVKGQTVRAWMEQPSRPSWTECVELFLQLGEGLAAAHKRGLVHRDFKPGNAVVDEDGRARVLDFGLARGGDQDTEEIPRLDSRSEGGAPEDLRDQTLTKTGAILGTPAYMSLEQANGRDADARSDQFSFCVSLYEALYQERPYEGDTLNARLVSMKRGTVRGAPRTTAVPTALRAVLLRGLAPDPNERWPSMEVLLEQMRRTVAPRRWRRAVPVTVGVGLLVVGAISAPRTLEWLNRCTGARGQLSGVWDDARKQAVEAAIVGTSLPYAPDTWVRVESRLDAYTEAWVAEHTDACEATRLREEQSEDDMGLRMGCLHERQQHLRATVGELSTANATVVENAVRAVTSLPGLERCRDLRALRAKVEPAEDPTVAQQVDVLDGQLVEAQAKQQAGRYAEALRQADAVVYEGEALGYEPLMARAWARQGSIRNSHGDYEGAEQALRRAYGAAVAHVMKPEAAAISSELVVVLSRLARHEEARTWAEQAEPLSRAAGTNEARAEYLGSSSQLAYSQAKYDEAQELGERSRALLEDALGPEHPAVADAIGRLGAVAFAQGKYDKAGEFYESQLVIHEESLGPDHPAVATAVQNLGSIAVSRGDFAVGRQSFERALAIKERVLGPDHPDVALGLDNLAGVMVSQGEHEDARRTLERSLAIKEQALGADHPDLAHTLIGLGIVARSQGKPDEARALYERALALWEKGLGPEHPKVAYALTNLGHVAQSQEKFEDARGFYERSVAVRDAAFGTDHPLTAHPLMGLGRMFLKLDQPADAVAPLERSLSLGVIHELELATLANNRALLARALWDAPATEGRDRPRARSLVEEARDDFAVLGDAGSEDFAEMQTWLAEHRLP